MQTDYYGYYAKHAKLGAKTGVAWVTWPTYKFWVPLNISGTAKDRNLKFGMQIDNYEYYAKHAKLGDKRAWPKSRDLLLNFGTTSISPERLKIETWNLVRR